MVKDEGIVANVGKTMTAMIYERCTLVTLPFTLYPPHPPHRKCQYNMSQSRSAVQRTPSVVAIFITNNIHHGENGNESVLLRRC